MPAEIIYYIVVNSIIQSMFVKIRTSLLCICGTRYTIKGFSKRDVFNCLKVGIAVGLCRKTANQIVFRYSLTESIFHVSLWKEYVTLEQMKGLLIWSELILTGICMCIFTIIQIIDLWYFKFDCVREKNILSLTTSINLMYWTVAALNILLIWWELQAP